MRAIIVLCVGLLVVSIPTKVEAQGRFQVNRKAAKEQLQRLANKRRGKQGQPQQSADSRQQDKARVVNTKKSIDPQFQPKPDLDAVYVIDRGNTAVILVANRGNRPSKATSVRLRINPMGGGRTINRSFQLASLEPNGTKIFNVRGLPLSNVMLFATVDPDNRVQESDESNNVASHKVEDQLTNAADLAITKIQLFPDEKQVWVTVHNYGRKAVDRAPLRLVSKFGLSTNERMRHTVKNLKPGLFQIFRFFPKQMLRGTQFEATVDLNNDVPEQNENNNRRVATF